jgi:hypothetical protein
MSISTDMAYAKATFSDRGVGLLTRWVGLRVPVMVVGGVYVVCGLIIAAGLVWAHSVGIDWHWG